MPRRELTEWMAFYAIEPRGAERADWHAGWIAYWTAFFQISRKGRAGLKVPDLVPFLRRPEEAVDDDPLLRQARTAFANIRKKRR